MIALCYKYLFAWTLSRTAGTLSGAVWTLSVAAWTLSVAAWTLSVAAWTCGDSLCGYVDSLGDSLCGYVDSLGDSLRGCDWAWIGAEKLRYAARNNYMSIESCM